MQFIGDQGLFYLPARDMLIRGDIPLVGPQTSHPWIHHGPLWIYSLAILFFVFDFNPIVPAYFTALLGVLSVWLLYRLSLLLFSKRIGVISALLFATSPLAVINQRMPYHTSLLPLLAILLMIFVCKWVKGESKYFPLITLLLAVLYNHELTTFTYFVSAFILLIYGFWKKKIWFKKIFNKRIILLSTATFLVPMIPFILYDIQHGFKQTLGFLVWVLYRVFSFIPRLFSQSGSDLNPISLLQGFFSYYQQIIYPSHYEITLMILFISFSYYAYNLYQKFKKGKLQIGEIFLLLFLFIPLLGLFMHRAPIEADMLLISPGIILITSVFFDKLFSLKFMRLLVALLIGMIIVLNSYYLVSTEYLTSVKNSTRIAFKERLAAVDSIIKIANGRPYNLIGRGELSNFPMFTMNYEYLLWWKGHPFEKKNTNLKIVVWEKGKEVVVYQQK